MKIKLHWNDPITAKDFDEHKKILNKAGVYLWLWNKRVCYVGQAGNFFNRFQEHFMNILAGYYSFPIIKNPEDYIEHMAKYFDGRTVKTIPNDKFYRPTYGTKEIFSF